MTDDHNEKHEEGGRMSGNTGEIRSVFFPDMPQSLEDLADAINEKHRACEEAARSTLEHASQAGHMLILAKAQLARGAWRTWLKQNFEGSERTAQGYMRVHREWDRLAKTQRVADLSLRGALRELSEPKRSGEGDLFELDPKDLVEFDRKIAELNRSGRGGFREWLAEQQNTAGGQEYEPEEEGSADPVGTSRTYAEYTVDLKAEHVIEGEPAFGDVSGPDPDTTTPEEDERLGEAGFRPHTVVVFPDDIERTIRVLREHFSQEDREELRRRL